MVGTAICVFFHYLFIAGHGKKCYKQKVVPLYLLDNYNRAKKGQKVSWKSRKVLRSLWSAQVEIANMRIFVKVWWQCNQFNVWMFPDGEVSIGCL